MKKAYRSLKSALTLNFVIVAALPAVVVGLIALKILSDSMEEEITVRNELLAKSLAAEVDRFLHHPLSVHLSADYKKQAPKQSPTTRIFFVQA